MPISLLGSIFMNLDIEHLGQVFTPQHVVVDMLALVKNNGRFLEPSCGNGAFFTHLPQHKVGIEIDRNVLTDSMIARNTENALHTDYDAQAIMKNTAESKKHISTHDPILLNTDFFAYPLIMVLMVTSLVWIAMCIIALMRYDIAISIKAIPKEFKRKSFLYGVLLYATELLLLGFAYIYARMTNSGNIAFVILASIFGSVLILVIAKMRGKRKS